MYKQQLKKEEIEKNMKNESFNIITNNERISSNIVNGDDVNVNDDGVTNKSPVVLYWSEDMVCIYVYTLICKFIYFYKYF
jgi:hypothetical protein